MNGKVHIENIIYLSLTPWVRFLTGYKVGLIEGDTAGELVVGLGVLNVGASLVSVEIVGDFVGYKFD